LVFGPALKTIDYKDRYLPCNTELSSWRDFRATEFAGYLFIYSSNPDDLISFALGARAFKIFNDADYSLKKYHSHQLSRSRVPNWLQEASNLSR
jgi:hypothetical protein